MSRGADIVEAAACLVLTRLLFALSPRRGTAALLRRVSDATVVRARARRVAPQRVAEVVERAALIVPDTTCLGRALTGWAMLRRRGVSSVVRLGARREQSSVHMHAWLELDGVPLIGREEAASFVVLTSAP